jgi:hypothetical protein
VRRKRRRLVDRRGLCYLRQCAAPQGATREGVHRDEMGARGVGRAAGHHGRLHCEERRQPGRIGAGRRGRAAGGEGGLLGAHRHVCNTGEPLKLDGVDRDCSSFAVSRTLMGAIQVDATCAGGPVTSTLHETFSGDFDAAYASDSQLTVTLQGQAPRTLTTHVAMRYVGDCPPPPPAGPRDAG